MSGIAEVHPSATLQPGKLELLSGWLPSQDWFQGDPHALARLAFFRFVDPAGEVGLDCMLIGSGAAIYHVPVTWRAAPLAGGAEIGTLEHSLLGTRYCYDAATDPVYLAEAIRVIQSGDTDAEIYAAGQSTSLPRSISVRGSGTLGRAEAQSELQLIRRLDGTAPSGSAQLTGTWELAGRTRTDILAVLS